MQQGFDLWEIRAVDAIARGRSLRVAAEGLNISQTSVSRHLQRAEALCGAALFRRGWSGAELTAAGELVEPRLAQALDAVARCGGALAALRPAGAGGLQGAALLTRLRRRDLAALEAVVAAGSVSLGAQAVGRGQPEVSRALQGLSQALGVPLLVRRGGRMQPLPAAQRLCTLAQELAAAVDPIPALLAAAAPRFEGRAAIGLLPFSGQRLIARCFARLSNQLPGARLVAVPGSYDSLVAALRRREIDRIIGTLRGPDLPPDLAETPLYAERFAVVARRGHPLAGARGPVAALRDAPWVVAPHGTPVRRYFESLFPPEAARPAIQTCEILSFAAAEEMLMESNSLGMLSYSAARLRALPPGLVALDLALPAAESRIGLTRLADAAADPATRAFEAILSALLAEEAPG